MNILPNSVQNVISAFERLPGVGPKSAARMAYYFLRAKRNYAVNLANALLDMNSKIVNCEKCFNVTENSICPICANSLRDKSQLCVVEEPLDVVAFENSSIFKGVYFVLGGVISPADGIGADELRFRELKSRVNELLVDSEHLEIIIATNPNLEGEATSVYIQDLLKNFLIDKKVSISRLAMGLPTGADLEYTDKLTLKRALEGRRAI